MTSQLPTPYAEFIYKSRYARWLPEQNRRENWNETVARYFDFFEKHLKENNNFILNKELRKELEEAVLNLEVMPSMRALMTAGAALERCNVAGYNPVSGDTEVLTKEYGLIPISELEGKEAHVVTIDSKWEKATFKSYGEQRVYAVNIGYKGSAVASIKATENHRWVLANKEVVSTATLKVGDKLPFATVSRNVDEHNLDYKLGVIHGLVYGDGTATYSQERLKGYHIRLCGKSSECLKYFEGYPVCYPDAYNGDPVVMLYSDFAKTHSLKELPDSTETEEYLIGFIRGWLAADGYVTQKNSQCGLALGAEEIEWFKTNATKLGYIIQNVRAYSDETNYGKRNKKLFCISIDRASLTKEDFLISYKAANFKPNSKEFTVTSITDTKEITKVYCAEVPVTNTFTLNKGIVTGNCAYVAVDNVRAFDEILYVLMSGTGVGFSVERQFISQLPVVNEHFEDSNSTIVVEDSKAGWAKGYRELIAMLYSGQVPKWDLSKLRPAGARLKTFGGRSSGPAPLNDLFKFTIDKFKKAAGRKLTSIECHDIICKVAAVVVVGGVRRSALISLSNLSDDRMRDAKAGAWWEQNNQRALANNSAVYTDKPDIEKFMDEWLSLVKSKSGERGIFSREAAMKQMVKYGKREADEAVGCNPCSEILLRPNQFCNLTEVVVRANDTLDSLKHKVRIATILGTMQATLTNFKYLRKVWKQNCEEEALLGVSLTGIMDNYDYTAYPTKDTLEMLRVQANETNELYAAKLGINKSAAITCVKPSGTVSQLVDSGSGIHTRHSPYYIRTVRGDNKDPLTQFLKTTGIPFEPCVMNPENTTIFSFPIKAPEGSITRNKITAIEHLELWLKYQRHFTEHKPSITISVKDEEWLEVGAWVYKHFDEMTGVSFLPYADHSYQQAPYQECTKEQYEEMLAKVPTDINWDVLQEFEKEDFTTGAQEMACSGNVCEIVDIGK